MEEATKYKQYLKGLERIEAKDQLDKATKKVKAMEAAKAAGNYAAKAAKASRIGKIAGAAATAGIAASAYLRSKMKDIKEKQKSEDIMGDVKGSAEPFLRKSTEGKMGGGMMNKYSKGKSVKGYGQARKSGMGLEDENISLGKGSDYIKDLL